VEELRAAARRLGGEVVSLEEADLEPARRRVEGDPEARRAAAHDEDVEGARPDLREVRFAVHAGAEDTPVSRRVKRGVYNRTAMAHASPDHLVERRSGPERSCLLRSWLGAFPEGRPPLLSELARLPGVTTLRAERSRRILHLPLAGGRAAIVKIYLSGAVTGLPSLVRAPEGEREFRGLRLFLEAGLPTAAPIGFLEERRVGIARASAVVLEALTGARDLLAVADALGARAQDAACPERNALLATLGALFGRAHALGLACGEKGAHIRNVLLVGGAPTLDPRLVFIDLPNALRAEGEALLRERARDLGRLLVRLAAKFGEEGRARFLEAYFAATARGPGPDAGSTSAASSTREAFLTLVERARAEAADETRLARVKRDVRQKWRKIMGLRGRRGGGDVRL